MFQPPVDVSLNFMPAFYHKRLGVTYGDAYYFDPRYRATVERAESRLLFEILGQFGVGSPNPEPSPSLFIQPIDLVKLTQGARLHCPPDATLETRGHPWAGLSVGQIAAIPAADAARHPIVDTLLRQYRELRALYGDRADVFGIASGTMNVHAPFTTAHQLCGEALFPLMLDDPDGARRIFAKVWDIYQAIFDRLTREMDAGRPHRLQLGDCSACMLSEETYRAVVLPVNRALTTDFPESGYHSCGASSHLLAAFAEIPRITSIELGPGTNLTDAVRVLPGVAMRPLIDPVLMRNGSRDAAASAVADTLAATAAAPGTTLCAWSLDVDTPVANVETLYATVAAWNGQNRRAS
ncbi:MAG: uroporphyrinogen decarboxylase family protein [Kiritimatiellae bacterium]|nr:uroporphyrinogen decarboxylase family protein [Kiritimatiellia bacterium]